MATYIRRKLCSISDGLAFVVTSGNIGNIRVGLLFPACPWMRSTVTTVTLMLRRKYCLSVSAYGLYGLKESKVMKAKILLLSLATLLLGACQQDSEPMEAYLSIKKTESMEERNEFVTNATAAMLQINAERYNCQIIETALAGGNRVRVTVRGAKEDLDALFEYVSEAGDK